jgi:uncharacterized protein (DUF1330 family)
MTAYLIAVETIHDEAMFAEYRKQVVATVEAFGGRFIARGGKLTVLEGQWQHSRTVIIEFPARDSAEGWYKSAEYQKIIGLRLKSTSGNLVILDSV